MTPEEMNQVKEAQAANDAAVHSNPAHDDVLESQRHAESIGTPEDMDRVAAEQDQFTLEQLKAMPIWGNHADDSELLNGLNMLVLDETVTMTDRLDAYDYMGAVMGLTDQPPTTEDAIRTFVDGCKEKEEPVAVDSTPPIDPNTVGQAVVDIAQASKDNPPAAKKPRRKPVKGVMAKARQMLAEGCDDTAIRTVLYDMYIAGGRDEKNAQDSAQLIVSDVVKKANQNS